MCLSSGQGMLVVGGRECVRCIRFGDSFTQQDIEVSPFHKRCLYNNFRSCIERIYELHIIKSIALRLYRMFNSVESPPVSYITSTQDWLPLWSDL